jgi:hypothetical protein
MSKSRPTYSPQITRAMMMRLAAAFTIGLDPVPGHMIMSPVIQLSIFVQKELYSPHESAPRRGRD